MLHFRKWLSEDAATGVWADPNQTADYAPAPGTNTTVPGTAGAPNASAFANQLLTAFQKLDPHIANRQAGGGVQAMYSGTPNYSAPEQARQAWGNGTSTETDFVSDAVSHYMKLFPANQAQSMGVYQKWQALTTQVQGFLRQQGVLREAAVMQAVRNGFQAIRGAFQRPGQSQPAQPQYAHPVMYQTTIMDISQVKRGLQGMKVVFMRQSPIPGLREAFVAFNQAWEAWVAQAEKDLKQGDMAARQAYAGR